MNRIGQRLRSERESKGASRVDVSHETKIAIHHIAALEYSDFDELPDAVHVKGYVRSYAEYLGLEPAEILEQFLQEYEAHLPKDGEDPRDEVVRKMSKMLGGSRTGWTKRFGPALIVIAFALVVLLGWAGWHLFGPGSDTGTEATAAAGIEPDATIEEAQPTETEPAAQEALAPPPVEAPHESTAQASERFVETRAPEQETAQAPPPVAASEPESPAPTPTPTARLSITRYGVGTAVENRQLRGESDHFVLGTQVWFFNRVQGGRAGDTIRHVWRHEGSEIASIPLRIGSANWRTYSRKTMHAGSAGSWTVEAVDEAGNILARSEFDCSR